jgi:4-hydroxy-4-methyl-2-oxoglutarate aldolase
VEPLTPEELGRVRALATSSLCDADKTLALPDPAIAAMVPEVRMAGPAVTVVAPDDHLPVLLAAAQAPPGSVLVVVNPRGARAVAGELVAA